MVKLSLSQLMFSFFDRSENVILRRVQLTAEGTYTSRAQFECAMTLFHRY
jgi:hypothetical protein